MLKKQYIYLDDIVDVDATNKEIYPAFALKNNLERGFLGQLVNDVIYNTKHQLQNPAIDDFITNLNYYDEHDCFLSLKYNEKRME